MFPFPYKFTLYILTMSYDALTTAGRHLLSAEAFSFADDGKDAIKDFEWSAFSFFFCVFYQKASGRRGPRRFSREQDNACIRAKSARARSLLPPRCLEKRCGLKKDVESSSSFLRSRLFSPHSLDPSIHSKAVARRIFLLCTGVLNHLKKEYFSKGGEFFPF